MESKTPEKEEIAMTTSIGIKGETWAIAKNETMTYVRAPGSNETEEEHCEAYEERLEELREAYPPI